jgi:hypothetical protein
MPVSQHPASTVRCMESLWVSPGMSQKRTNREAGKHSTRVQTLTGTGIVHPNNATAIATQQSSAHFSGVWAFSKGNKGASSSN